ncbi:hypothetical protein C0J52_06812 [Blattella germanica]|nr:hypothetical protein C0J52_06812 [Blattella germanica]
MKTVEETIPSAVFYKFVNQPEMNTTRMKIEELLTDIKDSLASRVVDAEWLIGNTSIGALEKLDYLNHTIGYPEEYLQEEYLESLFDENSILSYQGYYNLLSMVWEYRRKYGKYGELSNWWNINSTLAIEKKKKCFLRQYDKYQMYDKYLRPKNSEGENIADNGGIRHAYKAYKNFKDRNGEEPRLPGLEEYSNEQLFFLSFAYMWCSNYTRSLISKMVDEYYIPDKYRVIGSLSNMKEFSDAWNCPAGKFMNREEKCVIW